MNVVTVQAFGDEFEKLAVLGALKNYLHAGWNLGSENYPKDIKPSLHGWVGTGPDMRGIPTGPGVRNTLRRGWQHASGLGGLTKKLPVGPKGLALAFMLPDVYSGLKRVDPTGQGRGRLERLSGSGGAVLGGMLGAGAGKIHGGGWGSMIGGIGGSILGSRLANLPFRGVQQQRQQQLQAHMAQQQPQQEAPPGAY